MAARVAIQKLRVLLISANRCATPEPVFPLGLAHLNAAARRAGHEVRWLDSLFEQEQLGTVLTEFAPDVVGVSVRNIDDVLIGKREVFVTGLKELVETVHRGCSTKVILGGSGFSIFPRELLDWTGADYGIVGAGETAFVDLLEALCIRKEPTAIAGLVFRRGNELIINPPAGPGSAIHLSDTDWPPRLLSYYLQRGGVLNLQTQRRCGHRCCYCSYPLIEGRRHRNRDAEEVVEEFEQVRRLGADYVFL